MVNDGASAEFVSVHLPGNRRLRAGLRAPHHQVVERNIEVSRKAGIDELTGLPNLFDLNQQLSRLKNTRNPPPVSAFMIDIDHFKSINDTFGHIEGNHALIAVATFLKAAVRQGEYIARVGGDEFIILIADPPTDNPKEFNNSIIHRIKKVCQTYNEGAKKEYDIGLSIGGYYSPGPTHDFEGLFDNADKQMFNDKTVNHKIV